MITYVYARPSSGDELKPFGSFRNRELIDRGTTLSHPCIINLLDNLDAIPPANPTIAANVVSYVRAPERGGNRSIERQRESNNKWLSDNGLVAQEEWIERGAGTQINLEPRHHS